MPPARSMRPIRTTTPAHCRSSRRADVNGDWLHIHLDLPGRAVAAACLAGAGRAGAALSARRQRPLQQCRLTAASPASCMMRGSEIRILQEIVLGVGGWRTVEALAPEVEICHMNEGHAAFAILERVRTTDAAVGSVVLGSIVGDARRQFVHDAHAGGRRLRPVFARAVCANICALSRRLPRRSRRSRWKSS